MLFLVSRFVWIEIKLEITMNKIKRDRSANFNLEERDILVSLVFKHKDVLENKKSDASTWKQKEVAWDDIEKEFNARSGGAHRPSKALRIKSEGLKRSFRKKSANIRSELYRTGGGSNTAIPLDPTEEKMKSLITLSTDGMDSVFDSDVLPETQPSQDPMDNTSEKIIKMSSTSGDTKSGLVENRYIEHSQVEDINMIFVPSISEETVEVVDHTLKDNIYEKDEDVTPRKPTKITQCSSFKWDVTSRRNLKTRRHPALVGDFQKKSSIDELARTKLELVQIQKELLNAEKAEKRKESEFREKQRQWIEEEMVEKKKEFEFRQKQRKWIEEEHLLKLMKLQNELEK